MIRPIKNRRNRLGQSMVEFTLVGIPVIFALISIFEVSRGMWVYHTLAYSVKIGVRYAAVHGINCQPTAQNPNNCPIEVKDVAQRIRLLGVGLDPNKTTLTFTPAPPGTPCTLGTSCATNSTIWPTYDATGATSPDAVGQPIRIDIRTPFRSAITMFWPGSKPMDFQSGTLGASSQDYIQF
jgi:TadE-like protein